ncbi:MAG: DUF2970 domain-containing protein [Pseudomonas sp.]
MANSDKKPPSLWQMLHSVLAAALGVQSNKNRERDFSHGKPLHFIMLGLLVTGVFVLVIFAVVRLALYLAGI